MATAPGGGEVGTGKQPGGLTSLVLSRSNAAHAIAGKAGAQRGLDVVVTTPLWPVDAMSRVVLDEADRLLDATDVQQQRKQANNDKDSDSEEEEETSTTQQSGSFQTKTFLSQMDSILSGIPPTAVRALFSATVTPMVRSLAESILRNPVDLTVSSHSKAGGVGGANGDIDQELRFVGREEGKLLALRQMKARGELRPPALVFLQSQERAQARCCTTGCTWMSFTPVGPPPPGNGPWPNSARAKRGCSCAPTWWRGGWILPPSGSW